MKRHQVLVVEDDTELKRTLEEAFKQNHFNVRVAMDGVEALEKIREARPDLIMLDVNMPRMTGLECLREIKNLDPSIIVIVMTAYSNVEDAVHCIKEGAYNYLAKPVKHQAVVEMVKRALEAQQLVEDMAFSAPVVELSGDFIGNSNEMQQIFRIIHRLAKVDTSVLVRGESGTGKELVARAIHFNSSRKDQRLVAINCSSIPEALFESELFGHEKGAFTGADQRQIGKFQFAEGGTIFLDEIGDLSSAMQVKLLRVLQERKFMPVGSNREIDMNVRIIAATNRNLEDLIQKGTFREDLFYRLNVIPIFLPALRERKDDIPKLVAHFIAKFNVTHQREITGVTPDCLASLMNHEWQGNIRELENVVEHAFVIENGDKLSRASLPAYLTGKLAAQSALAHCASQVDLNRSEEGLLDYRVHREQSEKEFIVKALRAFQGRINQTAIHAKIPKKTLLRKLKKYNINVDEFRAEG